MSEGVTAIMEDLDESQQALLLAWMAHNLTISAREAYEISPDTAERLRRHNEIQHVLTSHIASLLNHSNRRPTLTLFEAINEIAGRDAIGQRIRKCVDWAFSRALKHHGCHEPL